MMNATLRGKPDAANPHVRFDEGEVAPTKPRRGSLLYNTKSQGSFRVIQLLSAICAFAVPAGVQAAEAHGTVPVESRSLKVVFDASDAGRGRVVHLIDKLTGREMVSQKTSRPLWTITCLATNDFTKKRVVSSLDADKSTKFAARPIEGGWEFAYRDVCDCLDDVVCRVTADAGDGMVRWRISSRPKPGWATYETDYPFLALTESIGTSPTDDCTHLGSSKGGVNRNPLRPDRKYWGWRFRHEGTSPGDLSCPYGAFYDPEGGLYTAAEDNRGFFKGLVLNRIRGDRRPDGTSAEGDLVLKWSHFEYDEHARALGYDVVMRGFSGTDGEPCDWRDAADIYRDSWASKQRGMATKFIDRPDLPDWMKHGPLKVKFNRSWFSHPGLVRRWISEYWTKRFSGIPFVVQTEGWEHHGDWVGPEYFPCYPSDEAFGRVCADLKKVDGHLWAWPGGHHWNVHVGRNADGTYRLDYTDLFNREVKPNCCAKPDGSPLLEPLNWLGGGDSATLCPATEYGQSWWNDYVSCGLIRRGAGLVQADQDVCGKIAPCWSRHHGHAPGNGRWMTVAMRHQFETMLGKMRAIDPQAQFSIEEPNEFYADIMCLQDYRNCRFFGGEWASAFNYLYHEYITVYQPGSELWAAPKWFWIAHIAADGQMPTFPETPDFYFEMPVLDNGSFEDPQLGVAGYNGWNSDKLVQKVVTGDATDGRYSLGLVSAAGGPLQEAWQQLPDEIVRDGGKFRVTFKAKRMVAGGRASACVRTRDAVLAEVRMPDDIGVWRAQTLEVEVPKGTEKLRIVFGAENGAAERIDDARLFKLQPDGAYAEVRSRRAGDLLAFAERWADLWHANAKWLQHGRHLHPPRLQCARIPYHENFRGVEADLLMPAVFVGAYRAADGTDALFFVNATAERQDFSYLWRGKAERRSLAPRELRFERL